MGCNNCDQIIAKRYFSLDCCGFICYVKNFAVFNIIVD